VNSLEHLGRSTLFTLHALAASFRSVLKVRMWLPPFASILFGSLPLVLVTGLAIGLVIWVHTRGVLEKSGTGAAELLPTLLAAAVVLELAPIGAGLILASRTAASLGAELASMKVNEQLDALAVLGVPPMKRLVGPRVLAVTLAAPLLFTLVAALALGSGYLAESLQSHGSWLKFQRAALEGVDLRDALTSLFKTVVMGFTVGVAGCAAGLAAGPGSEGVGRATTRAVVAAVLGVLIADVAIVTALSLIRN
jgi:phospholipid/cholesterol/gamma-HCH transport system permease protein